MPTDTKPFYRHILGTHWKDKPNKGLDVEVKKKKKKVSNFLQKPSSQPQARSCMPEFWHRQRRNFPDRCNGQHGNSFVVVPSQCMGVHVNGSSRHIDAALLSAVHQTRLTGAKRETSNQGSACQYPCGGKSTQKDSSIHACTLLSGLTCMDTSPKATAVTRTSKHRRKRRWRGYTLAPNRWGKVECYYITQESHNARHA